MDLADDDAQNSGIVSELSPFVVQCGGVPCAVSGLGALLQLVDDPPVDLDAIVNDSAFWPASRFPNDWFL